MNANADMGEADDTKLPSAIRLLGRGQEAETIAGLVERDLRERGLPQHVMCRWQREPRQGGEKKGTLMGDEEGFPVLKGFTPFMARKRRDLGQPKRAVSIEDTRTGYLSPQRTAGAGVHPRVLQSTDVRVEEVHSNAIATRRCVHRPTGTAGVLRGMGRSDFHVAKSPSK